MPREIITTDGATFQYRDYELATLGPDEVRFRVEFAAPKHGTEGHSLRGSVFDRKQWDAGLRMFLLREAPAEPARERRVGNMVVGTVVEVGSQAGRFRVGERVFGYGPLREEQQ